MDNQQYLSKIVGTLKYGWFSGEKRKQIIITFIIVTIFFISAISFFVTTSIISYIKNPYSLVSFIFTLITFPTAIIIVFLVLLILIVKNEKQRKEVILWLEDAQLINAVSKTIAIQEGTIISHKVKIAIDFEYNGIEHSCVSRGHQIGDREIGYHSLWEKYKDKELLILYSPKFDEVMVLKD